VPEWRNAAACLTRDPELFFPVGEGVAFAGQIQLAVNVCISCPVMAECLDYALERGEDSGGWGGRSPKQLRALRRNRARTRLHATQEKEDA
jgi:WhiB family redox-sensing transcriptional regulator